MNYLAHLLLADQSPASLVGGLLGDFAKGLDVSSLPPDIRAALLQHRRIDAFTDAHPLVRRSRARVSREFARFSGILVDVFYDHFLARRWQAHTPEPLGAFAARVYAALREHEHLLPERLSRVLPRMAREDWLSGYAEIENVGYALAGLERRFKRPTGLSRALTELTGNYAALDADFGEFFPELRKFVASATDAAGPRPHVI
jgi:acyl carrier protein phosphodiesterase